MENPPCISNWKNAKDYGTLFLLTNVWQPMAKDFSRYFVALQQTGKNIFLLTFRCIYITGSVVHINEKFAKLAESLYIADRKARESVELRAQLQKKQAQKEKEKKQEQLLELARKVREERAGLRPGGGGGATREDDDEAAERDNWLQERKRERQREGNLARAAPGNKKY